LNWWCDMDDTVFNLIDFYDAEDLDQDARLKSLMNEWYKIRPQDAPEGWVMDSDETPNGISDGY